MRRAPMLRGTGACVGQLFVLHSLLTGCPGRDDRSSTTDTQAGRARGAVVAIVEGAPIGTDDVRDLAQATGLTPREALSRLEEARLAEQHARRLGYDKHSEVAREAKRALVQALLAETVEREVRPEGIPSEQVRERFEAVRAQKGLAANSFAEHEPAVREQLATEQRQHALEALLVKLRSSQAVQLDEAELHKRLSDPALWGGDR